MPSCQHCQLNNELNTLKQREKTLDDMPVTQRYQSWRIKWDGLKKTILKTEKQLTETSCSCEDWSVATPVNNQPFTFSEPTPFTFKDFSNTDFESVPKFEAPKSSPEPLSITINLLKETQETWQQERERERERENNFNLNSIISQLN